jgi:hypothetical protein
MLQEGSCQLLTIKTPLRNKYLILTGLHLIREDMKNNVWVDAAQRKYFRQAGAKEVVKQKL